MPNPSDDCGPELGDRDRPSRKFRGYWYPAELARDRFWAARAIGDRRAMIYWSAREIRLRRAAHGAPRAGVACLSWRGRDLPRLA